MISFCAGTYKIPTINDIPIDFRVTLLKDAPNDTLPYSYSSKAVGEPPLFLGATVYHALKVTCCPLALSPWCTRAPVLVRTLDWVGGGGGGGGGAALAG
jgi:xanthine dehydrogenase molybdopterin-binding subunit B